VAARRSTRTLGFTNTKMALHFNQIQKSGIFATVLGLVVIFILHNPTEGYVTSFTYELLPVGPPAPEPKKSIRDITTKEEMAQFEKEYEAWVNSFPTAKSVDLDFFNWQSVGALTPRFAHIKVVILLSFLLMIVCTFGVWLFRTRHEGEA